MHYLNYLKSKQQPSKARKQNKSAIDIKLFQGDCVLTLSSSKIVVCMFGVMEGPLFSIK